ncbi:hypothetical protein ACFQ21_00245 [Ohtaekwangia kribbensis]|uniref:Thioredoxin n=1 Tax=Ohtaekwangia kribbensis TaxID=688913 RepID=A0ABW3JY41_9BACT
MKRFKKEEVGEVFQQLYDSEINIYLDSFYDEGYDIKFPSINVVNNKKITDAIKEDKVMSFPTFVIPNDIDSRKIEDVVSVLAMGATISYPKSRFTKWYKSLK